MRAEVLAEREEILLPQTRLGQTRAGYVDRSRLLVARTYARLLEGQCTDDVDREVWIVEVGVQRGRFGHSLLAALWAHSLNNVQRAQARRLRRRHGLPEDDIIPAWTWPGGPGTVGSRAHYVAVDIWQQRDGSYNDSANVGPHSQVTRLKETISLLEPFWHFVQIWQLPSKTAARVFDKDSLDFVYIDGAHDYNSVMLDLSTWWSKLRPGGLLGGDDYDTVEVIRAVADFTARHPSVEPPGLGLGVQGNFVLFNSFLGERPVPGSRSM